MDDPEKPATQGAQDTSQRKQKPQHDMCWPSQYANTHLEVKMNRTSFLCGNRNGLHNTELRT